MHCLRVLGNSHPKLQSGTLTNVLVVYVSLSAFSLNLYAALMSLKRHKVLVIAELQGRSFEDFKKLL